MHACSVWRSQLRAFALMTSSSHSGHAGARADIFPTKVHKTPFTHYNLFEATRDRAHLCRQSSSPCCPPPGGTSAATVLKGRDGLRVWARLITTQNIQKESACVPIVAQHDGTSAFSDQLTSGASQRGSFFLCTYRRGTRSFLLPNPCRRRSFNAGCGNEKQV